MDRLRPLHLDLAGARRGRRGPPAHRRPGRRHPAAVLPDSGQVAFQAYAEGNYHVYVIDLPDGKPRRLTSGPHDHREPAFSPDGTRIALASDRGDGYGIWVYDLESEELTAVTDTGADEAEPAWTPGGERIVYISDRSSVRSTDLDGSTEELVPAAEHTTLYSPPPAPAGGSRTSPRTPTPCGWSSTANPPATTRTCSSAPSPGPARTGCSTPPTAPSAAAPRRRRRGRRVQRHRALPAPRAAPGAARHRRHRRAAGARHREPGALPDGRSVAFRALGALWVMRIGKKPKAVVDDGSFSSDPDWHPGGGALVYSSDREGAPALWRHDLDSGADERLTRLDGAQVYPRWSPDGERIAYQDQDGATWIYDTASGGTRQVLPELFQPGRPTWSPDGRTLALAAVRPRSRRFREGSSQILTVDLESGETAYTEPAPHRSLSTRGDDGPVWSPDGRHLAFVMESLLWVVPVDGRGAFTGEPRRLTSEPTDAPSWSGDSASLLYLCNGRLRRVSLEGGRPETVETPLTWRRKAPPGGWWSRPARSGTAGPTGSAGTWTSSSRATGSPRWRSAASAPRRRAPPWSTPPG
ncbi:hypothetical protein ACFQXA_10440 [Nocardiopsis composta]